MGKRKTAILGKDAPEKWWDEIIMLRGKVAALEAEAAERGNVIEAHGAYDGDSLYDVWMSRERAEEMVSIRKLTQKGYSDWRVLPVEITETGLQRAKQERTTEPE